MGLAYLTGRSGGSGGGGSSKLPKYTYTGTSELVDDGDGNWRILLKTSGTLTFSAPNSAKNGIDVFLVGGGAGGALRGAGNNGAGGGGGGYTHTEKNITVLKDKAYNIIVGAGGARAPIMVEIGSRGGTTQAFGFTAEGGGATKDSQSWAGGDGGSGGGGAGGGTGKGGDGGVDGANGGNGNNSSGGIGQGTTTREFGEPNGTIYGCGGGGGAGVNVSAYAKGYHGAGDGGSTSHTATSAVANTGGGGGSAGAGGTVCGDGGSGIVIIRNARG